MDYFEVYAVYNGSDGEATKALYDRLQKLGLQGVAAVNIFRAMKCSHRAKLYRGGNGNGSYRSQAYERKKWSMDNLCKLMMRDGDALGFKWGWGVDRVLLNRADPHHHVLYIDLPTGQVSFHNSARLEGPDYYGEWDGQRNKSVDKIVRWVSQLLTEKESVAA